MSSRTQKQRIVWHGEDATQLAEFAITLPLLVVFVVGIFDFSGAFTLKQKLSNIARDAARAAAADPATDLNNGLPYSVSEAFYVFDNYLNANNLDDCGIRSMTPTLVAGANLTWQVSVASSTGSPCGITFTINRGYYFPLGAPSPQPDFHCSPLAPTTGVTQVVSTCVSIKYSYKYRWRFGRVASLLGNIAILPDDISAIAVAVNEN